MQGTSFFAPSWVLFCALLAATCQIHQVLRARALCSRGHCVVTLSCIDPALGHSQRAFIYAVLSNPRKSEVNMVVPISQTKRLRLKDLSKGMDWALNIDLYTCPQEATQVRLHSAILLEPRALLAVLLCILSYK